MSEDKDTEQSNACAMNETDRQGDTNLCCCYALDENDNHVDPCYMPVEECCCG